MARAWSMAWHAAYMDLGVLIDSFRVSIHAACVLFMLACNYHARAHHCGTARMRRFQTMPATPVWVVPTPHKHGIPIGACHEHAMMQKLA